MLFGKSTGEMHGKKFVKQLGAMNWMLWSWEAEDQAPFEGEIIFVQLFFDIISNIL